ncbi:DUF2336 domain-containing protein [Chelatococcus sp. SYSU_G07232]|uniref:DUF2336 domain-containing protein n=1 Tax=Chelatococcus albus TaxID=3047466 RepID=A0ABT7AI43_9HYPH|nr:DUF2336 domain-containing protein [Chelatococcus sp. SYSU_G07232]MDJ1159050.1 DUF2336 domain-containing protein [Chelatococcus sp. SYSU_G07232]
MHDTPVPDLSGLAALARAGDIDIRPVLLRVQTDLFLAAKARPPEAVAAFRALATGLIPVVDAGTLAVVAQKLAPHPDTPEAVIEALARAGGRAEEIVLALTPNLPEEGLTAIAATGPVRLAVAVARRRDLAPQTLDALVARRHVALDEALAGNPSPLPADVLATLVARARQSAHLRAALAALLLERADLPVIDAAALYGEAEPARRAAILAEMGRAAALDGRRRALPLVDATRREALVRAAARGDRPAFSVRLADAFGTSIREAQRLLADPSGDLLALALHAVGFEEEEAVRVFLTLDPALAQSTQRVFALAGRIRAVPREVAARVVFAVLGRDTGEVRPRAAHVPAMAPGGTTSRPALPGLRRPAPPERPPETGRDRSAG